MTLTAITDGLIKLLESNNYNSVTVKFYKREWSKIQRFLVSEYGNEEFEMERGLAYLEKQYNFITKYNDGSLTSHQVQLLRVIHMLEDYRLHHVLTRRYYAAKNPIKLNEIFTGIHAKYLRILENSGLAAHTIQHYRTISLVFLDYLFQKKILDLATIDFNVCNGYMKTLAGYSYKTVELNVCGLRYFLRFLHTEKIIHTDIASNIHMPAISRQATVPSAWKVEDLKKLLAAIDRTSPIGKRDYAMITLACILGLRISDIKALRFCNFDWNGKMLSIVQKKTQKPLSLPLPDAVGWAVIDYIKNGRPQFDGSDFVFLKHMPPFDPLGDSDHLQRRIIYHMNKAGLSRDKDQHRGFHSLRHSAGSLLLSMGTSLPVITTVLGQSDIDVTAIYLKTDIRKLAECVLPLEGLQNEKDSF